MIKIEPELLKLGYQIIALSADKPEYLQKSQLKHKPNYLLLSDSTMKAATAFGIAFRVDEPTVEKYKDFGADIEAASGEKHHLLPVPAAFVIGSDGVVNFSYVNPDFRIRVSSEVLLAAAKAAL